MGTNPNTPPPSNPGGGQPKNRSHTLGDSTARHLEKKARARILVEWLGGVDPPNPSRNIHQPGEFLDHLLKQIGLAEGVDEQRLKEVWGAVAGPFVAQHTVPESIRGGVLVLRVLQPTMKFHLQQMSGKLLDNLHRELGDGIVKQVVFKIG
ncbi:MAG: DUF721 domain-containing protein [Akkermansiaceae bacterium]|nr:DUF721 domain-containing protein [Akkermansiaceae bacterium]